MQHLRKWHIVQFHLYTAMVVDDQRNGIPVVWYLTSRACTTSVETFLTSLLDAGRKLQPDFAYSIVGCNDDPEELKTIGWVSCSRLCLDQTRAAPAEEDAVHAGASCQTSQSS